MRHSYSKGVLVWIDDNFLENKFLENNIEIDKWQSIFGAFSKKIYRLLDIELKILTNKADLVSYLENSVENTLDTYYYFIVDLSLPEFSGSEAENIYGLEIGEILNKNHTNNFCFLSSSSSAGEEMKEMGLESVDYFVKFDDNNLLLPESLRYKILLAFRNNINWIDLEVLQYFLHKESNIFQNESKILQEKDYSIVIKEFPYFGKYKDFIDQSEYESNLFDKPFFIRSHPDNSFDFESQCILIMMADRIFNNPNGIVLEYDKFSNEVYKKKIVNSNDNTYWIIDLSNEIDKDGKLKTTDVYDFTMFYQSVKNKRIVFVIDNNESAEKFLEPVDEEHSIIKDLPYIHEYDQKFRNIVIENSIDLLLNYFYSLNYKMSSVYIEHPELLIHPKNMMFLKNQTVITSDMTDSHEIIRSIFSGMQNFFENLTPPQQKSIELGNALQSEHLIQIAENILQAQSNKQVNSKSLVLAIDHWLRHSWQYPYGIELHTTQWKKFSFDVLLEMMSEFNSLTIHSEEENIQEMINSIKMISEFLKISAIQKIITETGIEILTQEWEELAYIRWPHLKYPMPLYLNELLEHSNKHLWIQHKNYNFIGYSKKLIFEHRKLNNMLEYYDKTLSLMKQTHHFFPSSMQDMFILIIDGIEKKKEFDQSTFIDIFSLPLANFMDRFLEISMTFRSTYGLKNRTNAAQLKKIKDSLKITGSFGKDIGIIEGAFKEYKPFSFKTKNSPEESIIVNKFKTQLSYYVKKGYFEEEDLLSRMETVLSSSDINNAATVGNAMLMSNLFDSINEDTAGKNLTFKNNLELIQNSSIIDHTREMFSQFEYFDLHFNIIKNIDCLTLLQSLTLIRNKVIAHKDKTELAVFDLEYLYESFVYSYEGMLLQYQYVLAQLDDKSDLINEFLNIETNYIELNPNGHIKNRMFKVTIINKQNLITINEELITQLHAFFDIKAQLTKTGINIEEITLTQVSKIREYFKLDYSEIICDGHLNLNDFIETSELNGHIEIQFNKEWLNASK
jgi:hypothetical protein